MFVIYKKYKINRLAHFVTTRGQKPDYSHNRTFMLYMYLGMCLGEYKDVHTSFLGLLQQCGR